MPIRDDSQQQNTTRQHPIPQNVMDVEFKVVGDLTVRQLMYLFAGGTFAYLTYRSGLPFFWRFIISGTTVITSIGVAFFPYQERGLDKWLVSFIKAVTTPTQMVWRKTYSPPAYFLSDYANIIKNEIITLTPAKSRNKLDDYLGQLSETETELDIIETRRLESIKKGFSTKLTSGVVLEQRSSTPTIPSLGGSSFQTTDVDVTYEEEVRVEEPKQEPKQTPPTIQPKPPQEKKEEKQIPEKPEIKDTKQKELREEMKKDELETKKELLSSIELKKPTLGNAQIDRAMINIPSETKGEIKIRTTTKLPKTIVVQDIKDLHTKESSLEKKVGELLDVARQVRGEMQNAADKQAHIEQNKGRIDYFSTKYKELQEERKEIRSQLDESTHQVKQIEPDEKQDLGQQVETLSIKNEQLKKQLEQIQAELAFLRSGGNKPIPPKPQEQKQQTESQPQQKVAQPAQPAPQPIQTEQPAQSLNQEAKQEPEPEPKPEPKQKQKQQKPSNDVNANIISGVVKDKNGKIVDSAVVIIKDKDGDAIRALKTNQLGQFRTQTPMQNGKYTIEIIKGGMKFDIIAVEATGNVISPLSIIANG